MAQGKKALKHTPPKDGTGGVERGGQMVVGERGTQGQQENERAGMIGHVSPVSGTQRTTKRGGEKGARSGEKVLGWLWRIEEASQPNQH